MAEKEDISPEKIFFKRAFWISFITSLLLGAGAFLFTFIFFYAAVLTVPVILTSLAIALGAFFAAAIIGLGVTGIIINLKYWNKKNNFFEVEIEVKNKGINFFEDETNQEENKNNSQAIVIFKTKEEEVREELQRKLQNKEEEEEKIEEWLQLKVKEIVNEKTPDLDADEFYHACTSKNFDAAKKIASDKKRNINQYYGFLDSRNKYYRGTLLNYFCSTENLNVIAIKLLLENGADPNLNCNKFKRWDLVLPSVLKENKKNIKGALLTLFKRKDPVTDQTLPWSLDEKEILEYISKQKEVAKLLLSAGAVINDFKFESIYPRPWNMEYSKLYYFFVILDKEGTVKNVLSLLNNDSYSVSYVKFLKPVEKKKIETFMLCLNIFFNNKKCFKPPKMIVKEIINKIEYPVKNFDVVKIIYGKVGFWKFLEKDIISLDELKSANKKLEKNNNDLCFSAY